jgi:two-component system, chemotaxis family, chemotaxis protein CheY
MAQTVLVIDDSTSIRLLERVALERAGYTVVEAVDGEDAIDKLDGRSLSAIVCDIAMPRMDGLSFLRYLRMHPRYKSTPLMLLTTESRPQVREAARTQGAQAFLSKPCAPDVLVSAVQRLCK